MTAPVFRAITLPGTVMIVDPETIGGAVVIRMPTRAEIEEIESAAAAGDIVTVLGRSYGLAGLDTGEVHRFSPEARAALDDAIVVRISEAREAILN